MKVWVVLDAVHGYNRDEIVGIYSTEEKAQKIVTDISVSTSKPYYFVEEWEVQ